MKSKEGYQVCPFFVCAIAIHRQSHRAHLNLSSMCAFVHLFPYVNAVTHWMTSWLDGWQVRYQGLMGQEKRHYSCGRAVGHLHPLWTEVYLPQEA